MVQMVEDPAVFRGERIAHLIESTGPGGAERMVAELAMEQRVRGARTTVFLPDAGEEWLASQLDGADVAIERYRLDSPLSPQCVRTLANGFRKHGITLAHSHEFSMAVNGTCAARAVGIPHVSTADATTPTRCADDWRCDSRSPTVRPPSRSPNF